MSDPPEQASKTSPPRRTKRDARPRFLRDYPNDPALAKLIEAFERGDYASIRQHAPRVAEQSADEAVRAAARELLERTRPDPTVKHLLAVAFALLFVVVIWIYFGAR